MSDIIARMVIDYDGEPIAIEFVDSDGYEYFIATDPFWIGVRKGPFPMNRNLQPFARVEIARLPIQAKESDREPLADD